MVGYFNIRLFKVNFKFHRQLHPQVNCFQGSLIFIFPRLILFLQLKNLQSNLYGLYNSTEETVISNDVLYLCIYCRLEVE